MLKVAAFKPLQQTLVGQYNLYVVVASGRSTRLLFNDMVWYVVLVDGNLKFI